MGVVLIQRRKLINPSVAINRERKLISEAKDWNGNMLCQHSSSARCFGVGENLFAPSLMADPLAEENVVQRYRPSLTRWKLTCTIFSQLSGK